MKLTHLLRYGLAFSLFATVFVPQQTQAQLIWSGAGTNDNWSTVENWGGIAPTDGSALVFQGNLRLINTNDLTLASNSWVRFDSEGFVLNGNPLFLTQGITNSAGTNTIAMNL